MYYLLKRITIVVILFLSTSSGYSQQESNNDILVSVSTTMEEERFVPDSLTKILLNKRVYSDWRKIEITDQLFPRYLNSYSLISEKNKIRILDSTDRKIRSIQKRTVDGIIKELLEQIQIADSMCFNGILLKDPLTQFGLDSNWYMSNILDLWSNYQHKNGIELSIEQLKKSNLALMNYSRLNRILRFPNNFNIDESALIDIKIIYDFDTLHIQTTSCFPFMLEWYYFKNKTRLANHKISILVGDLLTKTKIESDNLNRLMGVDFQYNLMDDIYKRYLVKEVL